MKRLLMILGTMCLGLTLSAQPGTVGTREANDQSGRLLTMEETILARELSPKNLYCTWLNESSILMHKDGKWQEWDMNEDSYSDYLPYLTLPHAYTEGQNLMVRTKDGKVLTVAESENENITYGQFTSRNEFGINEGFFWSPDSTRLAFYRKDETAVSRFPLLDITTRTGSLKEIRYPMAGMDSEKVGLGIYDMKNGKTVFLKVEDFGDDRYLTNITWSPDGEAFMSRYLTEARST